MNVILTFATLPNLYGATIAIESDYPSYFYYYLDTFDKSKFPDKVYIPKGVGTYIDGSTEEYFINTIKKHIKRNPNSKIHFYVDDARSFYTISILKKAGGNASNSTITFLPDGTLSYNDEFKTRYSESENVAYSRYQQDLKNYLNWSILNNVSDDTDTLNPSWKTNNFIAYAQVLSDPNHRTTYYLQHPDLLESSSEQLNFLVKQSIDYGKVYNTGIVEKHPKDFIVAMTEDENTFYKNVVKLGNTYDEIFNRTDEKKVLIFSGASAAQEGGIDTGNANFEKVANKIVEKYGSEYAIYYKPHPRWDPKDSSTIKNEEAKNYLAQKSFTLKNGEKGTRAEFLDDIGIESLPGSLPLETIIYTYGDKLNIGGYNSSLYMSVKKPQLKFFVTNNPQSLSSPLPEMINKGIFGTQDTDYIVIPLNGGV